MNERQTYLGMCRAMPGGADAMAAALGLTRSALDNRIYERRGQTITVDQALQMAEFTGSPLFAQMVAARCGGVFVPLPPVEDCDRMDLLERWMSVYTELGELSVRLRRADFPAHAFRNLRIRGFDLADFLLAVFRKRDIDAPAVAFTPVPGQQTALNHVFDHSADSGAGHVQRFGDGLEHDALGRDRGCFHIDRAQQTHLLDGQIPVFPVVGGDKIAAHVPHQISQCEGCFPETSGNIL